MFLLTSSKRHSASSLKRTFDFRVVSSQSTSLSFRVDDKSKTFKSNGTLFNRMRLLLLPSSLQSCPPPMVLLVGLITFSPTSFGWSCRHSNININRIRTNRRHFSHAPVRQSFAFNAPLGVSLANEEVVNVTICSSEAKKMTQILADDDQFVKPERDPRSYRTIRLQNNLIALLVCDERTSGVGVEAASVHVQAGHLDDTIPGLARKL